MCRNLNHLDLFSGTYEAECRRKVVGARRIAGAVKSLVINAKGLLLECARVLHETLFVPVLMYSSQTMIRMQKEMSKSRAVQMNNFKVGMCVA